MTRATVRMIQGIVLAVGAPLGWLGIQVLGGASVAGELSGEPDLYLYMLLATMIVFALFGRMLGRGEQRLLESNRQLDELTVTDPLTGLRNSRYFHARVQEAEAESVRTGSPYAIVVIDIDHFKRINDQYGHMAGDVVLTNVAATIGSLTRHGETVARVGGEEFALLLPGSAGLAAKEASERIRVAIERAETRVPVVEGDRRLAVTASAGVASTAELRELSSQELYMAADSALYAAKQAGRNRTAVAFERPG